MFPPPSPGSPGGPYAPPGYGAPSGDPYGFRPPDVPFGTPAPVWPWYVAYAVAMALLYLACVGGAVALGVFAADIPASATDDMPPVVMAVILGVIGLPLFVAYAAAPFLPKKPWAWTYHLVLICISLTSACCMIAGIPLLIYWMKPETKAMFGKPPT